MAKKDAEKNVEEELDELEDSFDDEGDEYDDEEYDDEEYDDEDGEDAGEDDEEDPTWWLPHAVLGTLLLIGMAGFFGAFNKWLGPIVNGGDHDQANHADVPSDTLKTAAPAAQPKTAAPRKPPVTRKPRPPQPKANPQPAPPVPKDVAAAPADAKKTASGLAYKVLKKGKGTRHPKAADRVEVHYSGWTKDGKMFDSSVTRGRTITFSLRGVIKGWTEGVQLMKEGDKFRFWIPAALAYGEKPRRPGAPSGALTFDVELVKIQ